jgi:hypothetical protein
MRPRLRSAAYTVNPRARREDSGTQSVLARATSFEATLMARRTPSNRSVIGHPQGVASIHYPELRKRTKFD